MIEQIKDKLLIIYLPLLLCLLGMLVGYTFLNWLVCIELNLVTVKKDVTNFAIPMILSICLVFFVLRPKIKIFNFNEHNGGDWNAIYYLVAWLGIAVPTIITQDHIHEAGISTELSTIEQIHETPLTQYYTISNFIIDKKHVSTYVDFNVSGRYNEDFHMTIYFVAPILVEESSVDDDQKLVMSRKCDAWMGVKYFESISNRLNTSEKEERYKAFWGRCFMDYQTKHPQYTYMERLSERDGDFDLYEKAIENNKLYASDKETIILKPETKLFEERSKDILIVLLIVISVILSVWAVMITFPTLDKKKLQLMKNNKPDPELKRSNKEYLELLIPRKECFFTPILNGVNVIIFLIMMFVSESFVSFKPEVLISWGANYTEGVENGEWWRLFTSIFIHAGFMHLCLNVVGLWLVGIMLEPILGRVRFLLLCITTGVFSSYCSFAWYDKMISVGASGVVFGLMGCILSFVIARVYGKELGKFLAGYVLIVVGINLFVGLVTSGIDNSSHIGGFVSGFVMGFILYPTLQKKK